MFSTLKQGTWDRSLCAISHELQIVDPGEKVVIGGQLLSEEALCRAAHSVSKILFLITDIYRNEFNSDIIKMATHLGFSPESAEIMSIFPEDIKKNVFARGDLIFSDNQWKLIELNTGTTVGGIFYASMPRLSGYRQTYDTLHDWAKYSAQHFDFRGEIVFIEDTNALEHMKLSLHVMTRELEKFVPCKKIHILGHRDVTYDGKTLKGPHGKIDTIYRLFNERDIKNNYEEYSPILSAIKDNSVSCPMSPKFNILSNKGILALLWEKLLASQLSEEHETLVKEFVPYTFWVTETSQEEVLLRQNHLVIKPIDGNGGLNVFIGAEYSSAEWQEKINEIIRVLSPRAYVAQNYEKPPIMMTNLAHPDGKVTNELQKVIWGVFVFGEENLGGFIRAKSYTGSNIINHANGASVGPIPYCEWMVDLADTNA